MGSRLATWALLGTAVGGVSLACTSGQTSGGEATAEATGTVGLALTLPGGVDVATVSFVAMNGYGAVIQKGFVSVASSAYGQFVLSLPAASADTLALQATSVDGAVTCAGTSSPFEVLAGSTNTVPVTLVCNVSSVPAGGVDVIPNYVNCPIITSLTATPSDAFVGTEVTLTAAATGPDPKSLTLSWSAPLGKLGAPTSAQTQFECTQAGAVPVTLTVSNGPLPKGTTCPGATETITVTCEDGQGSGSSSGGACGTPINACGGCGVVAGGSPGDPCGSCPTGTLACSGPNSVTCTGAGSGPVCSGPLPCNTDDVGCTAARECSVDGCSLGDCVDQTCAEFDPRASPLAPLVPDVTRFYQSGPNCFGSVDKYPGLVFCPIGYHLVSANCSEGREVGGAPPLLPSGNPPAPFPASDLYGQCFFQDLNRFGGTFVVETPPDCVNYGLAEIEVTCQKDGF